MNPSDEIKSRLDIVELIREYITVKPAGVNFRALCPFHNEKSPSFVISPEKQIWHCFGCGKGGDIFTFVQEMESLTFLEALRVLAPKAGVELREVKPEKQSQRNRLLDAMDLASRYYHAAYYQSKEAEVARYYLKRRGLKEETIKDWRIGYSRERWDDILSFLLKKGFKEAEIFAAGLTVKKEKTDGYYDRFRGRIMFPIRDLSGNVVAFTARVSPHKEKTEKMGKYINSPQTYIYDKSRIVFGLDKARQDIKKKDSVIIVEGQMDVITSHQAGFSNTVATSGTAITEHQIDLIKRYTNNFIFALDADTAGQNAIEKGGAVVSGFDYYETTREDRFGRVKKYIDPLKSYKINQKVIEIPEGKDPDDFIRQNPQKWEELLGKAKPIMQYFLEKILSSANVSDIEGKNKVIDEMTPKIVAIGKSTDRDYWIRQLAQKVDVQEAILREKIKEFADNNRPKPRQADTSDCKMQSPQSKEEKLSEMLLALILSFPENIEYAVKNIQIDHLSGSGLKSLYRYITIFYNNLGKELLLNGASNELSTLHYKEFKEWLSSYLAAPPIRSNFVKPKQHSSADIADEVVFLDKLMLLGERDFYSFSPDIAHKEILRISIELKRAYLTHRQKEIENLLRELEKSSKDKSDTEEEIKDLMRELKLLSDERKELDRFTL